MPGITTTRWVSRWWALEPAARVRAFAAVALAAAVCAVPGSCDGTAP